MLFVLGLLCGAALAGAAAWWLERRRQATMARFFSFAAHEINTPITAINMTVLNFLSGVFGKVDGEQLQWLELMREQLARLSGMVGELRDLIHMRMHGDLSVHLAETPLAEAVETALRAVRRGCAHAGIDLAVDLPRELPPVRADPDRLPRSIASLLFHARKFRLAGGIAVSARAGEGPCAEVDVEYQGPALAPGEAERALELFYPAERRHDRVQGATGLGLGVVRALLRAQGGDLLYQADAEGRSRLRLLVPRAR